MAQTWTSNCFDSSNDWDDDLQAMENNHLALQSSFSGASAPTSPVQGQLWEDTGSGALKKYDGAAWMAVLQGDADFKVFVYRNDTCDGWNIDATVTDRVIAVKGGTGAYNADGGTNAGETWANLKAHTHGVGSFAAASHKHLAINYTGLNTNPTEGDGTAMTFSGSVGLGNNISTRSSSSGSGNIITHDIYTNSQAPSLSGTSAAQSTSDVRPQACLTTCQYPDLT